MTVRSQGLGQHNGNWETAYEALAFTAEALSADAADEALRKLGARVDTLLRDWETIDADRRKLRRAALRATAQARVADARLDHAIGEFARDLLAAAGNDEKGALYTRFFPESHEDVIALGLDSEVPEVTLLVQILSTEEDLPGALKGHLDPLRDALRQGNSALADRADALAELGRHGARVEAWLETAQSAARSTQRALDRLAGERKLPATWALSFFAG